MQDLTSHLLRYHMQQQQVDSAPATAGPPKKQPPIERDLAEMQRNTAEIRRRVARIYGLTSTAVNAAIGLVRTGRTDEARNMLQSGLDGLRVISQ